MKIVWIVNIAGTLLLLSLFIGIEIPIFIGSACLSFWIGWRKGGCVKARTRQYDQYTGLTNFDVKPEPVEVLVMESGDKTVKAIVFASDTGEMIVKIATDDFSLGIEMEHAFIRHKFPEYEIESQSLIKKAINDVQIPCDLLVIRNETDTKEVFFDMSEFRYPDEESYASRDYGLMCWLSITILLLLAPAINRFADAGNETAAIIAGWFFIIVLAFSVGYVFRPCCEGMMKRLLRKGNDKD